MRDSVALRWPPAVRSRHVFETRCPSKPPSERCHDPFCQKNAMPSPSPSPLARQTTSDGRTSRDLDPADWSEFRSLAHAMLDDIITHVETVRDRPVWQPAPAATRERFRRPCLVRGAISARCSEISRPTSSRTPPAICTLVSWAGCTAPAPRSAWWPRWLPQA